MSKIGFFGFVDFGPYARSGNAIFVEREITNDLNLKIRDYDVVILPLCPLFSEHLNNLYKQSNLLSFDSNQILATDLAYSGIKLALEQGSHICFLYCDIEIEQLHRSGHGGVLGGRFLEKDGLVIKQPYRSSGLTTLAKRLDSFVRQFSNTKYYFKYEDENKQFKHPICCLDNDVNCVSGFALQIGRGFLYFLPVNPTAIEQGPLYITLSECILDDITTRLSPQASPILESFQFEVEKPLRQKKQKMLVSLEQIDEAIAKHQEPKDILFLRDDPLADRLPQWLMDYLKFRTRRHDEYVEDFWLLDEGGNEAAICEAKGLSSNVKREHITQLVQHREQRDLPDDFPSILLVNTFSEANSVKDKDRQRIVKLECQKAAKNHVLIVRTLDLVRILDLVWQEKLDISKVRELLLSETGWLKVTEQGYEVFRD